MTARVVCRAGQLDTTFGDRGAVVASQSNTFSSLALDGMARIVVSESRPSGGSPGPIAIRRYLANGQPDLSFGTGGLGGAQNINEGYAEFVYAVADDSVRWFGTTRTEGCAMLKFLSSGTLDTSFGTNGVAANCRGAVIRVQPTATHSSFAVLSTHVTPWPENATVATLTAFAPTGAL